MKSETAGYDIFISYASEDFPWVQDNLFLPLLKCRLPGGAPPRIYLDKSDLGLKPGEMWGPALGRAVRNSRRLIAVISPNYFDPEKSGWTQRELVEAMSEDPIAKTAKVIPLVINSDENTLSMLRDLCGPMHFLDIRAYGDWFTLLQEAIGFEAGVILRELQFATTIPNTVINNTIATVSVTLLDTSNSGPGEEFIEVFSTVEGLQGTLQKQVVEGIATFADLSFKHPARDVVLTARATGCKPADSNSFDVIQLSRQEPITPAGIAEIPANIPFQAAPRDTRLLFFPGGRTVVTIDSVAVRVFDSIGRELGGISKSIWPRFVRAEGGTFLLAGWSGDILLLREDGSILDIARPTGFPFTVPGDAGMGPDSSVVGMWNGDVFRLDFQGNKNLLFNHPGGVQCLVATSDSVFLSDLAGNFSVYECNQKVYTTAVERSVIGMKVFSSAVVIVGERYAYQFLLSERRLIACTWLQLSGFTDAVSMPHGILAINENGHGILLDHELVERFQFHTTAGARLHCIGNDQSDIYMAFIYPDNTYVLLKNDRVIFTNPDGLISFDSRLNSVAVGRAIDIQIRSGDWVKEIQRTA